jgi:hypothetical protein
MMPIHIGNNLIRPQTDKRFHRLHKAFEDAVRSGKRSDVVNVLLRADLPGERAGRTADKILADYYGAVFP